MYSPSDTGLSVAEEGVAERLGGGASVDVELLLALVERLMDLRKDEEGRGRGGGEGEGEGEGRGGREKGRGRRER